MLLRVFRFVCLSSVLSVSASAWQVTFTEISGGNAWAFSPDAAHVAGTKVTGQAFLWSAGSGTTVLGELGALGVSSDGSVVLGNMTDSGGFESAGIWTSAGGWVELPGLGGTSGLSKSSAYALSDDGAVAVGLGWVNAGTAGAFRWTAATGTVALPQLGPNSSRASAISRDGDFIGGFDEAPSGFRRAAVWDTSAWPTVTESLILVSSSNPSGAGEVNGVSSDGTFAVGTENAAGFVWSQAAGTTNFGQLPGAGGFDTGWAAAVRDDGQMVVGGFRYFPFGFVATIWTPAAGLERLDDYLLARGASNVANYDLQNASSITPDGRFVLGYGVKQSTGQLIWFLVDFGGPIGTSYCGPAVTNSSGASGTIEAYGSDVAVDNAVQLRASNLATNQFGYFLTSQTQGFITGPGGSQGNLCLGGAIGRYSSLAAGTGSQGEISLQLDLTQTPTPSGFVVIQPGETWNWTTWFRDKNPGPTSNFTDGISVLFQ